MRTLIGLLAFHGVLLALGFAFMYAVRMPSLRLRAAPLAIGLAHLVGAGLAGLAGVTVLALGAELTLPVFLGVALLAVLGLCGVRLWLWRRTTGTAAETGAVPVRRIDWAAILVGAVVAAFVLWQIVSSRGAPTAWDAGHNWTLKAVTLLHHGNLDSAVFRDAELIAGAHQDYPIWQPVFGALIFRFAGTADQGLLIAELWLLAGALVAATVFLLRRPGRSTAIVMAPLALALSSATLLGLLRGDADVAMALFLAAGVLCVALWLERGSGGLLALAVLLLAVAANTKNEGMLFAFAALAVAALLSLGLGRRALWQIAAGLGALVLTVLPWRVWVHIHGPFPSDVRPLRDSLNPALLGELLPQLDTAARLLLARLLEGSQAFWLLPAFLVLAIVMIAAGPRRRATAFLLASLLATLAALLWVYWTSPQPDVTAHIERTTLRTVTGPIFLAATGLAYLLSRIRMPWAETDEIQIRR